MKLLLLLFAFVALFYEHTNARPEGAPASTCISMQPGKAAHGNAKTSDPPYTIEVDKSYYNESTTVKVYIKASGNATIGGFLIEAREIGKNIPLGIFSKIMPNQAKFLDCTSMNAESEVSGYVALA